MNFGPEYAGIYDALYRNKDYKAEADFVLDRLRSHLPEHADLLDLGCGTGLHAVEMAQQGYRVTGIDQSADMVARAQGRAAGLPEPVAARLNFAVGDMRTADLGRHFDAVLSLFHVICYMTDDAMVRDALNTMRRHLAPGGVVLFDFWHADAVLNEPPQPRERIIEMDDQTIKRLTTPRWEPEKSLVHITYDTWKTGADGAVSQAQPETHTIRYFSRPELESHLTAAGFAVPRFGEWLTDAEPSKDSFGVYCLAEAA